MQIYKLKSFAQNSMAWRQSSPPIPTPSLSSTSTDSLTQITKIRLQNTKLKVQLQAMQKNIDPLNAEIQKMERMLADLREQDGRNRGQLLRVCVILGCFVNGNTNNNANLSQLPKIDDKQSQSALIDKIQRKAVEIKDRNSQLQREISRNGVKNMGQTQKILTLQKQVQAYNIKLIQKQQQLRQQSVKLQNVTNQLNKTYQQQSRKDSILAQLSHKVTQLQIQKKDIESEMKALRSPRSKPKTTLTSNNNNNNNNNTSQSGEETKKQIEDLLGIINVKDDDYLKSYLLKNQRFHGNLTNFISKRNKYDFVFQD